MISDGWWIFGERWIAGGCPISFYPFFSCVLVFTSNPQNNKRSCIFLDLLGVQKMLLDRLSMLDMAFTEQWFNNIFGIFWIFLYLPDVSVGNPIHVHVAANTHNQQHQLEHTMLATKQCAIQNTFTQKRGKLCGTNSLSMKILAILQHVREEMLRHIKSIIFWIHSFLSLCYKIPNKCMLGSKDKEP